MESDYLIFQGYFYLASKLQKHIYYKVNIDTKTNKNILAGKKAQFE